MSGISGAAEGVDARYERLADPRVLETMRHGFNQMNKGMVPLWRLGLARMMNAWPQVGGRILVLEHVGRRSGTPYRTPVNFTTISADVYVLAAFGEKTHWYRNIMAAPDTAVWLPDGRWLARAEDASDEPDRLTIIRRILIDSGLAAPMLGLHPRSMTDETLDAATSTYRLLRLRPARREPSPDGPGSLAWIWIVLVAVLAVIGIGARSRASPET